MSKPFTNVLINLFISLIISFLLYFFQEPSPFVWFKEAVFIFYTPGILLGYIFGGGIHSGGFASIVFGIVIQNLVMLAFISGLRRLNQM